MNAKQAAAHKAVQYIKDGMIVGLGTGSTAYWAIQYLGEKVKQGMRITAIATSGETERLALECGIKVSEMDAVDYIDIDIDGADEIDRRLNLIKGGGGALLREKIVAAGSKTFIVIADGSKMVEMLGQFPLPVEIIPFGWQHTARHLALLGCQTTLRQKEAKPFITDNGNYILDCQFGPIPDPAVLQQQINNTPGVVENGLFVKMATRIVIGYDDGTAGEFS
jgi:ribose 5-phosphate isomerase A